MSWDFTADSVKQTELSKTLTEAADTFDTKVGEMYTSIDSMGTSGSWVGEDYNLFKTGAEGYKTALGSARDSIKMFADHFTKLSTDTTNLANTLVQIISDFSGAVAGITFTSTLDSPESGAPSPEGGSAVAVNPEEEPVEETPVASEEPVEETPVVSEEPVEETPVASEVVDLDTSNIPRSSLAITGVESYVNSQAGETYEGGKLYSSAMEVRDELIRENDILNDYLYAVADSDLDPATKAAINQFLQSEYISRTNILFGDRSSDKEYLRLGLNYACSGGFFVDDGVFYDAASWRTAHHDPVGADGNVSYAYYDVARQDFNNEIGNLSSLDGINEYLRSVGLESIIQE